MAASAAGVSIPGMMEQRSFHDKLNAEWHERALQLFMVIVLGHWAEHLVQAYQNLGPSLAACEGGRHSRALLSLAHSIGSPPLRFCDRHADRHLGTPPGLHRAFQDMVDHLARHSVLAPH